MQKQGKDFFIQCFVHVLCVEILLMSFKFLEEVFGVDTDNKINSAQIARVMWYLLSWLLTLNAPSYFVVKNKKQIYLFILQQCTGADNFDVATLTVKTSRSGCNFWAQIILGCPFANTWVCHRVNVMALLPVSLCPFVHYNQILLHCCIQDQKSFSIQNR